MQHCSPDSHMHRNMYTCAVCASANCLYMSYITGNLAIILFSQPIYKGSPNNYSHNYILCMLMLGVTYLYLQPLCMVRAW